GDGVRLGILADRSPPDLAVLGEAVQKLAPAVREGEESPDLAIEVEFSYDTSVESPDLRAFAEARFFGLVLRFPFLELLFQAAMDGIGTSATRSRKCCVLKARTEIIRVDELEIRRKVVVHEDRAGRGLGLAEEFRAASDQFGRHRGEDALQI